jgi:eukaryotic-like serine/threonine-protein kinase
MKLLEDIVGRCTDVISLAEDGQKKVLAAIHPEFGPVVMKYGNYRYATSLERITREVTLLRELESRYYPKHYEFLIEPVRREFLVVEERLNAVELTHAKDRFASDAQILGLLVHLICALDEIWRRNVVHRDIKPGNILITPANEPRIIDLGIARFLDDTSLTATVAVCGPATPIYAAPEQLINRKAMINARTDFFLLGILVLELMHGFHPFDPQHVGNQNSLVENIMNGIYVAPDGARDGRLIGFVERALEPPPFKRFRTVDAVMAHLGMDRLSC